MSASPLRGSSHVLALRLSKLAANEDSTLSVSQGKGTLTFSLKRLQNYNANN